MRSFVPRTQSPSSPAPSWLALGISAAHRGVSLVARAAARASFQTLAPRSIVEIPEWDREFDGLVVLRPESDAAAAALERSVAERFHSSATTGRVHEVWILPSTASALRHGPPARVRWAVGDRDDDAPRVDRLDALVHALLLRRRGPSGFGHSAPAATWLGAIAAEGLALDVVDPVESVASCAAFARDRTELRDLVDQLCRMPLDRVLARRDASRFAAAADELVDALVGRAAARDPELAILREASAVDALIDPGTADAVLTERLGFGPDERAGWLARMRVRGALRVVYR